MLNSLVGIIASSGGAAAVPSYESIASATGTGSSATITFSSIPSGYTSLQVRLLVRQTGANDGFGQLRVRLNGNTSTSYAWHQMYGDGANPPAATGGSSATFMDSYQVSAGGNLTSGIMGVGIIDVHDYTSTARNKTLRAFYGGDSNGGGAVSLSSGLWANTSAVTSLSLILSSEFFTTTTQVALYGIKGA